MPKYPGVRKKRNKWYYRLQYNNKRYEKGSFDTAQEANRSRLEHLVQFQSTIVKTRTQAVAHNTMSILRKILNKTVEWELIAYNPLKGRIPSPPNTEHSVLTLEQLFPLVEGLKEWRLESGSPEWVFKGKAGNPFSPGSWCRVHWEKIKKDLKLPKDLRFHDLRHNFASILLSEGADLGDVQKLLRHSSYRTTADIYRHLMPGQLHRNFRIFTKLCGEQSGGR